jgi:hypothetical protein
MLPRLHCYADYRRNSARKEIGNRQSGSRNGGKNGRKSRPADGDVKTIRINPQRGKDSKEKLSVRSHSLT